MVSAVNGTSSSEFDLKKKPKEWNCAICGVSATSEKSLNDHLHSKKHKAKETALRIQEVPRSTEASLLFKESEKIVMATEKIILVAPPGLDPKVLEQFPQPSF